ncbi:MULTISPECIES: TIR domain-containing protein [unclassified Nostoc]|uniref:TIR domain-containing protein n=1 Tax=unclassified Nostoc TaxID=2593658 RepID=UPI002AD45DD1|nr:TIR domain-containing protein [Nostoc sp. DedQUE03]MDZ7971322.1 TIR domain-containing protein [Nostoc sp. DedQUE03]MDZ8043688.1 TIR domain-containing protein [Nostoc sp. DedQUE02]
MSNIYNLETRPRVFVSYASADKAIARVIVEGLRSRNINVWLDDYELYPGTHWTESIRFAVSASAYFLLLLSKNLVNSHWVSKETEAVLKELQNRDITFLPVLLEDCEIPSLLATYQFFDMRSGIEENLEKLVNALSSTVEIDFEKLSPHTFEQLVTDLLQKLGFINLQSESKQSDSGIDAIVEFRHKDPFGAENREVYAVETKFYRDSRADLRTLKQLIGYVKNDPKIDKALLVTNGNLTSVALDWVSDAPKSTGIPIRVVDGTELKRLLLQNTDLVSKYFTASVGHA